MARVQQYLLSDAFAVPATFVRIFLADSVCQCTVEHARSVYARQEVTELHMQLRRHNSMVNSAVR